MKRQGRRSDSRSALELCPKCPGTSLLVDGRCAACGHTKAHKFGAKARMCCPVCTNNWPATKDCEKRCSSCGCQKCIRFDSTREMTRYIELRMAEKAGAIQNLTLQPKFPMPPGFAYVGDFAYDEGGKSVVEDTKGMRTPVFNLKVKCLKFFHPSVELRITK